MAKNLFNYNVKLVPLSIKNQEQNSFRMELNGYSIYLKNRKIFIEE
ncbi:hypothetical protein [Treponema pectinovorum]|nr:hypothetical protein [Treponema pectinovorum]